MKSNTGASRDPRPWLELHVPLSNQAAARAWVYEEQYRCVPRSLVHIVDGVSLDFNPVIMKRVEVGIHPVRTTDLLLHLASLLVLQLEAWMTPGGGHDCPLIFR